MHPWPSQDLHPGVDASHQEAAAPGLGKGDVEAYVHPDKVMDSPDSCRELQVVPASGQILQKGHLQGSKLNLLGWESIL